MSAGSNKENSGLSSAKLSERKMLQEAAVDSKTTYHMMNGDNYHREVVGQVGCIVVLHVIILHWNRTILHELLEVRKRKENV